MQTGSGWQAIRAQSIDGLIYGPYSESVIPQFLASGRINGETLLSTMGTGRWLRVSDYLQQREPMYYYRSLGGQICGPINAAQIVERTARGEIEGHTPVAANPKGPWKFSNELRAGISQVDALK